MHGAEAQMSTTGIAFDCAEAHSMNKQCANIQWMTAWVCSAACMQWCMQDCAVQHPSTPNHNMQVLNRRNACTCNCKHPTHVNTCNSVMESEIMMHTDTTHTCDQCIDSQHVWSIPPKVLEWSHAACVKHNISYDITSYNCNQLVKQHWNIQQHSVNDNTTMWPNCKSLKL